jgi:hypothetical protein
MTSFLNSFSEETKKDDQTNIHIVFGTDRLNSLRAKSKKPILPYLYIDKAVNAISAVMIHDVVNPPAASRYYAYVTLGAYNLVKHQQ